MQLSDLNVNIPIDVSGLSILNIKSGFSQCSPKVQRANKSNNSKNLFDLLVPSMTLSKNEDKTKKLSLNFFPASI